ncbi:hypothetical protein [Rossellomorea sp. RS05]|uniref:hypothetical protein n=1 Tax=Rossellomorea sp. RS05 TaxID=3149166 RepID=UPI00322215ED
MKRKALDSDRNRGKLETPEAQLRRLDFLPAESKRLQRKGTVHVFSLSPFQWIIHALQEGHGDLDEHSRLSTSKSALKRKAFDSDGNRGKIETPEAQLRRLDFLPAESKRL